jgi:hypothetical protein
VPSKSEAMIVNMKNSIERMISERVLIGRS